MNLTEPKPETSKCLGKVSGYESRIVAIMKSLGMESDVMHLDNGVMVSPQNSANSTATSTLKIWRVLVAKYASTFSGSGSYREAQLKREMSL